jgi:hypothetical protein
MKWIASLVLVLAVHACGAGDDTVDGTNAQCAFGGAITDCPDAARTSEAACWRLVDCAAIPLDVEDPNDPNAFDWGVCVDELDELTADRQRIVINCIAAATCDELRVDGFCGEFGR